MSKQIPNPFIYATDIVCGIDYSIRTPCLTLIRPTDLYNTIVPFDQCEFYYMTHIKRDVIDHKNIHGTLMGDWDSDETRYETIADWAIDVLKKNGCKTIGLEDYAYGAANKSALTQLAENQGLLKYKLHLNGIDYAKYAPTSIKKFATGNGRSVKAQMYDAWLVDTQVCLQSIFNRYPDGKIKSPVSDIVDSYYIALSQRVDMCHTNFLFIEGQTKEKESK